MTVKEFNDNCTNYCTNDDIIDYQIFVNARICNKKHLFLKLGIYGLIPYGLTMLFFIVMHALVFA